MSRRSAFNLPDFRKKGVYFARLPKNFLLYRWVVIALCTAAVSGCSALNSARMLFPKSSGTEEVHENLYVEPTMTTEQRQSLQNQIKLARSQIIDFYGSALTSPTIIACITRECDIRFGSYGERAAALGDSVIRLSHRGQTARLIAHEWSHAEVYRRLGGWWRSRNIPRWFDEGVAVTVANEPMHSEENWQEIRRRDLQVPKLDELKSFGQWGASMKQYGETLGDSPNNLHVVYTLAGHEIRNFLSCNGVAGLLSLLEELHTGANFEETYKAKMMHCQYSP